MDHFDQMLKEMSQVVSQNKEVIVTSETYEAPKNCMFRECVQDKKVKMNTVLVNEDNESN